MDTEVYVLSSERSAKLAAEVLHAIAPDREPAADEFPFPQFADAPVVTLARPEDVIARLDAFPNESYSMYWYNRGSDDPVGCMLYYTEDGGLIVGVVVRDHNSVAWLRRLASLVGGAYGYLTGEEAPPDSTAAFIERARTSTLPRLHAGTLIE